MNIVYVPFAVVIPLYNKGPHIDRALDAVAAQTVQPAEIIIVDDGSTDDGLERVKRRKHPLVKIICRSEAGPGGYAARNAAIEAAQSEWIAFLDADDSWEEGALEEYARLATMADEAVACLFTAYRRDYGHRTAEMHNLARIIPEGTRRFTFSTFVTGWLAIGQSPMWTSAVAARRSALKRAGLFPAGKCRRGGDKDLWLRLLATGDAIGSTAVTATYHRDSVNMVTKTISMNHSPFLCSTLRAMLPTGDKARDALIKRLVNREIYDAAREALRNEGRVSREVMRGFFKEEQPVLFAVLIGLTLMPRPVWHAARAIRRKL